MKTSVFLVDVHQANPSLQSIFADRKFTYNADEVTVGLCIKMFAKI